MPATLAHADLWKQRTTDTVTEYLATKSQLAKSQQLILY
jgi:hypothetical protein